MVVGKPSPLQLCSRLYLAKWSDLGAFQSATFMSVNVLAIISIVLALLFFCFVPKLINEVDSHSHTFARGRSVILNISWKVAAKSHGTNDYLAANKKILPYSFAEHDTKCFSSVRLSLAEYTHTVLESTQANNQIYSMRFHHRNQHFKFKPQIYLRYCSFTFLVVLHETY